MMTKTSASSRMISDYSDDDDDDDELDSAESDDDDGLVVALIHCYRGCLYWKPYWDQGWWAARWLCYLVWSSTGVAKPIYTS